MPQFALGMIETRGLVAAIEAADAAAKTAEIRLLGMVKVTGGLVMIRFVGETASVQAATDAGAQAAARVGELVAAQVIPRLDESVAQMIGLTEPAPGDPLPETPTTEDPNPAELPTPTAADAYQSMMTPELRALARSIPGFPIKGRELNRLSKEQLIRELLKLKEARD